MKRFRFAKQLGEVLWPFARPYVPSYDPRRRKEVREAARRLVTLDRWPGLDATSKEVAQLAVLRLLDLQRLTRASARLRQHEAAAMLSRASVETTIVGIWCMCDENAVKAMQSDNAASVKRMLLPLIGSVLLPPPDAVNTLVAKLGVPKRFVLTRPLGAIKRTGGTPAAQQLYDTYWAALSSNFAHGTGVSLLRHVNGNDELTDEAAFPWVKRSPAHLADLCVGVLCSVVAGSEHPDYRLFTDYATCHDRRTAGLLGGIAVGHLVHESGASSAGVIGALRELKAVVDFRTSPEWNDATTEVRVDQTRRGLTAIFGCLGMATEDLTRQFAEHIVGIVDATEAGAEPGSPASDMVP